MTTALLLIPPSHFNNQKSNTLKLTSQSGWSSTQCVESWRAHTRQIPDREAYWFSSTMLQSWKNHSPHLPSFSKGFRHISLSILQQLECTFSSGRAWPKCKGRFQISKPHQRAKLLQIGPYSLLKFDGASWQIRPQITSICRMRKAHSFTKESSNKEFSLHWGCQNDWGCQTGAYKNAWFFQLFDKQCGGRGGRLVDLGQCKTFSSCTQLWKSLSCKWYSHSSHDKHFHWGHSKGTPPSHT